MRVASIVLFLASQTLLGLVSGQDCMGDHVTCGAGAFCNAADMCECNEGQEGDPRVLCLNPTRCLCTALADPQYSLFDGQDIKINLPCSMYLVKDTRLPSGVCPVIQITAHPEIRQDDPTRVFVDSVTIMRGTGTADLTADGLVPSTAPTRTEVTEENGFLVLRFTQNQCANFRIGFNASYGAVFVNAPPTYAANGNIGLCGTCNDDTTDEATGAVLGGPANLAYGLTALAETADQKGDFAAECGALQAVTSASPCDSTTLVNAATYCSVLLDNPFATCMLAAGGYGSVISAYADCVEDICAADESAACASIIAFEDTITDSCDDLVLPPGCT